MHEPQGWEIAPMIGLKFLTPLAVAYGTWEWLGQDSTQAMLLSMFGIVALCLYRIFRKFRKEAINTWRDFFDRNMVEIILFAVIAPSTFRWMMEWGAKFFGG